MFRKASAIALVIILIFSLAACGKSKGEAIAVPKDKKVAILVAPKEQYPEDYLAAMALQKEYPDTVVVKEYSDSRKLVPGDGPIISISCELAADPTVGAIVYARATEFAYLASAKAKAAAEADKRELFTIAIEPEDIVKSVSNCCDLVIGCDWAAAAEDIAASAKKMGAEYFVFFTFDRHIGNDYVVWQRDSLKAACEKAGIAFVEKNGDDPTNAAGINRAKQSIKDGVGSLILNEKIKGEKVVLFSTDSSVQSTLVEIADSKGMMYITPNCPSAYSGLAEAYSVEIGDKLSASDFAKAEKKAASANKEGKGKFAAYNGELINALVKGSVITAFDMLNGTTTADNLTERASVRFTGEKNFTFNPVLTEKYPNVFGAYDAVGYDAF